MEITQDEKLKTILNKSEFPNTIQKRISDGISALMNNGNTLLEVNEKAIESLYTILFDYIGYANEDSSKKFRKQMYSDVNNLIEILKDLLNSENEIKVLKEEMVLLEEE